jgi:hypothetical protein
MTRKHATMTAPSIPSLLAEHTPEDYADFIGAMMRATERPNVLSLLIVRDENGDYFARGSATVRERAAMCKATLKEMQRLLNANAKTKEPQP